MPKIFLDSFPISNTRTDYFLDLIFDEMLPNLRSSGIDFERKNSTNNHIHKRKKNFPCNLKLNLKSTNNSSDSINIFYIQGDSEGFRAAKTIKKNLMLIYYLPDLITVEGKESADHKISPEVNIELYNVNSKKNENWIKNNVEAIGQNLAISVAEIFGLPFIQKCCHRICNARKSFNLMNRPNLNADVVTTIPGCAKFCVLGEWEDWYVIEFDGYTGYAETKYVI